MSAAIFGSRILGLAREMTLSALFGAGTIADAFVTAFRIPNLLRDLLAEGALSSAFVPTMTATLERDGRKAAAHLGNLMFGGMLILTGILTAAGMVFAEQIVEVVSGFTDPDKLALTTSLTRLMMPFLCVVSLAAVWMGMLNAQRHFVVPALAPGVFNIVSLSAGVVVWALGWPLEDGIVVWSAGTLVAGVGQALMQVIALYRMGYRPWPQVKGLWKHPGIRRVLRLLAPAVVGVGAVQLNVVINTRFSGQLGDGVVSQLGYAFRLFFLPLGVFGVALATVTTTSVSEAAAQGDHEDLAKRAASGTTAAWMLAGASAVGLAILAEPVCSLIYRLGETDEAQIVAIAACLQSYVVGLAPYSLVKILAPSFYAIDRPRIPLLASVIGVSVNIVFNALTFRYLEGPGIALGTALGATCNLIVLRIAFGKIIGPLGGKGSARRLAALVISWAVLGALSLGGKMALDRWLPSFGSTLLDKLALGVGLMVVIGVAFFAYASLLRALKYPGADLLLALPRSVLRRIRR